MKHFALNKVSIASLAELQQINGGVDTPSDDDTSHPTNTIITGHDPSNQGIGTITP